MICSTPIYAIIFLVYNEWRGRLFDSIKIVCMTMMRKGNHGFNFVFSDICGFQIECSRSMANASGDLTLCTINMYSISNNLNKLN